MNLTVKKSDLSAILSKASSVTENKATMPILAPISMERLQSVSRPSTERARTAEPAYSTA